MRERSWRLEGAWRRCGYRQLTLKSIASVSGGTIQRITALLAVMAVASKPKMGRAAVYTQRYT